MKKVFKTMAFTLLGLVLSVNVWGATETVEVISALNLTASKALGSTATEVNDYISLTANKNESTTAPTFNYNATNGTDFRMYKLSSGKSKYSNVTFSASDATISKIEFLNKSKEVLNSVSLTPDCGTLSGGTWTSTTGVASVTFTNTAAISATIYGINVTYTYEGEAKTLSSIVISGTPSKTAYETGESFDVDGLTVTGTYSDASTGDVTADAEWTINPATFTSTSQTSVSVTATVDGKSNSKDYAVTVTEFVQTYANTYTSDASLSEVIKGSKVKWEGCKVTDGYAALKFGKGETASIAVPAGTKTVHLHMVAWNEESVAVTVKLGSTTLSSITPAANTGVAGNSPFTITTEPKTENSYYFAIEVNAEEATTLSLTTASNKRAILFGVNFEADTKPAISADVEEIEFDQKELSGTVTDSKVISATGKNLTAAISASMKSGSDAIFSVVANGTPTAAAGEFTVSYSTTEAGEYAGTVVLSSGETSIEIPVSASVVAHIPVLQSIVVSGTPTKTEYTVGDAFETAGLVVTGTYDVGEPQTITEGIEWEVDPEKFETAGTVSVDVIASVGTIISGVFTVENINVVAAPLTVTYDFESKLYGHSGVSSGSNNHDGDVAENEIFTESPTQIKFTKSGSTVTRFWKNNTTQKPELRIYSGAEYTISSENYNIIQIVFAGTDNVTFNSSALSNHTWTGKQKSVSFGNGSSNSALTSITVTYQEAAPSAVKPTITPSAEAETYWDPITVTLATTTEGAAIYYTTNGDAPTTASSLYEAPFQVSATTTIKAIAVKEGLDNSEVASETFTFGPVFTSLEGLVAATDLTSGTTVKVSFENVEIKKIDGKGVYFDIQKENKDIEIYYTSEEAPSNWVVEGKLSGTMICPWKRYTQSSTLQAWELAPAAGTWAWTNLTYNAPAGTTEVVLTGTPTKTTYIDGEAFDPAGITVTATINGVPTVVTEGITWSIETLTLGTTSINITATYNDVVSNTIENFAVTVNAIPKKTINEFVTAQGGRCYLLGVVSNFNTSNKRFNLTDETGTLNIYSHSLATGIAEVADGEYIKVLAETYSTTYGNAENVIVVEKPSVAVTGVSLDKENAEVQQGQSLTLVATITPEGASNKNLTWSIINDNASGKISVDQDGKVTIDEEAVPEATATVQVETEDGHYTDACVITVKEYKAVKFGRYYGDITEGDYVITAIYQESEGAMNNSVSSSRLGITEVAPSEDYIIDPAEAIIWHITADGDNWTISNVNGYAASTGTKSQIQLQEVADKDSKAIWAITAEEDDVYDIESVYNRSLSSPVNSWLRRNQGNGWACYAKSTGPSVKLYKKDFKAKAVLASIAISGDLTKKDYFVDQKILPAGLTVTGTYSDGNHETITEGITWNIDPESFSEETESGSVQITATVEGITSPAITINNIVVTEKPNIHTYGYFDFTTNGPDIDFSTGWSSSYAEHVVTAEEATVTFESASKQGTTITNMPVSKGDDVVLHLTEADKQIASVCLTTEQWNSNTHTITIEVSYDGTNYTELTGVSGNETNGVQANISDIAITYVKFNFSGTKQIGIESLTFTTADIPYVTMREELVEGKMYSFCSPYDLICVKGAIFYQPDYMDAAYVHFVQAEEIKAGYGYIIEGKGEALKAVQVGEAITSAVTADAENTRGMQGVLEGDKSEGKAGFQFTETSYNHVVVVNNHLQYVGALNIVPVGRAYLDLGIIATLEPTTEEARPGARRVAINFGGQAPTNLDGINGNMKAAKVLRDGQLYIIRDTKIYNAQGIEVQ